jgi:hypothetical protein
MPTEVGTFAVVCTTELTGDENNANDRAEDSVTVIPGTGVEEENLLPRAFFLDRAQPNPFTRRTVLRYGLPRAAEVELRVYSAEGRLVRTLAQGLLSAGHWQAVWNGRDDIGRKVGRGIYYCRLESDGFTGVTKLVLR